jgi:phosphoglycerate dehydrogenase-like enzyme
VVLIVPLTEATRGLIGAPEIALMKHGALLVNAARGPVVVTDALVEALVQHRIRAAVDVTDPEPLASGHPALVRAQLPHHAAHRRIDAGVYLSRVPLRCAAGKALHRRPAA